MRRQCVPTADSITFGCRAVRFLVSLLLRAGDGADRKEFVILQRNLPSKTRIDGHHSLEENSHIATVAKSPNATFDMAKTKSIGQRIRKHTACR